MVVTANPAQSMNCRSEGSLDPRTLSILDFRFLFGVYQLPFFSHANANLTCFDKRKYALVDISLHCDELNWLLSSTHQRSRNERWKTTQTAWANDFGNLATNSYRLNFYCSPFSSISVRCYCVSVTHENRKIPAANRRRESTYLAEKAIRNFVPRSIEIFFSEADSIKQSRS